MSYVDFVDVSYVEALEAASVLASSRVRSVVDAGTSM
jgi:hypothetical protein